MPFAPVSEERLAEAKHLLDNGATYAQVKESTGLAYPTLRKYFGKKDPKPGGRRNSSPPKATKVGPTDEQLTSTFTKIAVAPAVPMALVVHCDYCAKHFADTGPGAAEKLVELSRDNPALRTVMETVWKWGEEMAWATLLVSYFGIPLAHHLAPNFLYGVLQMFTTLPARETGEAHTHDHPPTNGSGPTPYSNLDDETLMRMAQEMGIVVEPRAPGQADVTLSDDDVTDLVEDFVDDATATAPAEEGTDQADAHDADAANTEASETVAPDSDTGE